jgi:hypothetical protein
MKTIHNSYRKFLKSRRIRKVTHVDDEQIGAMAETYSLIVE